MRIFPQSFVHGLFLSLKDLYIFIVSAAALLSFLAIKSHSVFDNSVNASTPQLTKNWLGWGGAYFADRRYDTVFVYHNGASSYYAVRGFRGVLRV